MDAQLVVGAGIVLAAGILQGLFAVPMKFARDWNYENIWLVFALTGLVLFPWMLTFSTVPNIGGIYQHTSTKTLAAVVGFGILWGAGATLTGLGLNMLGIGLGLAIVLGLSASVGSLVPLLVMTPEKLGTRQGHLYLAGTAVMLVGIGVAAYAGALRDQARTTATPQSVKARSSFLQGLCVVTAAGLLSSALNFCYAFGAEALTQARAMDVSPVWISNVVAAPSTTGGFLANCCYCAYLLRKNGSAFRFSLAQTRWNWLHGTLMGAFWFGGLALYGVGVVRMGSFGTVVGWPLLMGTIIITSNAAGIATGEWQGLRRLVRNCLFAGMLTILVALWILSLAQNPDRSDFRRSRRDPVPVRPLLAH